MSESNGTRRVNKTDGGKGSAKKQMTKSRREDSKKETEEYLCPHCKPAGKCQNTMTADDHKFLAEVSKKYSEGKDD